MSADSEMVKWDQEGTVRRPTECCTSLCMNSGRLLIQDSVPNRWQQCDVISSFIPWVHPPPSNGRIPPSTVQVTWDLANSEK